MVWISPKIRFRKHVILTNSIPYLLSTCASFFWNLRLLFFASLFIICVPTPTSAFQQLRHILPCFLPSFIVAWYQIIFFIIPIQLHHQLLLLYPLPLLNGVFAISPPSNSFMYLIYMWNLRKGWINAILAFYLRVIQCLLLIWSSYSLMACYYLDCVRLIF